MTQIFIHIGTPKTGTTSIQNFLTYNYTQLKEQGILYVLCPQPIEPTIVFSHVTLFRCLLTEVSHEEFDEPQYGAWDQAIKEIEEINPKIAVISSENFIALNSKEIDYLKSKYFVNYDVKVIVYVRQPLDYLLSLYKQFTKTGITEYGFSKFLRNQKIIKMRLTPYESANYCQRLEAWSQVFGKENIIVRVFDKKLFAAYQGGVIGNFLNVIGATQCDLNFSRKIEEKNISPSNKQIKVLQFFNTVINFIPIGRVRKFFRRKFIFYLLENDAVSQAISKIPDFLISNDEICSPEEKEKISNDFRDSYEQLIKTYLPSEITT